VSPLLHQAAQAGDALFQDTKRNIYKTGVISLCP
jgi:hypothetical protein